MTNAEYLVTVRTHGKMVPWVRGTREQAWAQVRSFMRSLDLLGTANVATVIEVVAVSTGARTIFQKTGGKWSITRVAQQFTQGRDY